VRQLAAAFSPFMPRYESGDESPHFHEKATICQAGIGRATWCSTDAALLSLFRAG